MLNQQICYDGSRANKLISNADAALHFLESSIHSFLSYIFGTLGPNMKNVCVELFEQKIWYDNVYVWSIKMAVVTGSMVYIFIYTRFPSSFLWMPHL